MVVSFIGMATQEVAIKQTVNITLKSDAEVLEEVVVTGYGVQRKASFTGAAAIIGEDVIAKKSDANFVKALEGAVPGVQMSNSTSMPGVWSEIYVRGRGSLNSGTQPLYLIDGMPINSETDGMSTTTNNNFDPMAAINPSDIESVNDYLINKNKDSDNTDKFSRFLYKLDKTGGISEEERRQFIGIYKMINIYQNWIFFIIFSY